MTEYILIFLSSFLLGVVVYLVALRVRERKAGSDFMNEIDVLIESSSRRNGVSETPIILTPKSVFGSPDEIDSAVRRVGRKVYQEMLREPGILAPFSESKGRAPLETERPQLPANSPSEGPTVHSEGAELPEGAPLGEAGNTENQAMDQSLASADYAATDERISPPTQEGQP